MIEEGLDSRVSHYMLITIVIPQSRPVCYKIQSRGRDPRFQSDGHPAMNALKRFNRRVNLKGLNHYIALRDFWPAVVVIRVRSPFG